MADAVKCDNLTQLPSRFIITKPGDAESLVLAGGVNLPDSTQLHFATPFPL